jgi:hypothetical protein
MDLAPSDYVILALAAGGALTGLFIGFSGALAFLAGSVGAMFAARIGWPLSASYLESGLARGVAVALGSLFVFWVVRAIVRRMVKCALAQPGDAIFGAAAAAVSGFAVGLGVIWLAQFLGIPGAEGSVLLAEVVAHV